MIALLVVYHALCIYTGGWPAPEGVEPNAVYWWLGHLISGFRIETIAFVGGYVMAYQCCGLGKRSRFVPWVWKKMKRLLLPAIVFGTFYYFLFRFDPSRWSAYTMTWKILNGIGHLWFLPMLFWCFILAWALDAMLHFVENRRQRLHKPFGWLILFALALLSLWQPTGGRLGLTRVPHFAFYFYAGYWLRVLLAGEETKTALRKGKPFMWTCCGLTVVYLLVLMWKLQAMHYQLPAVPWTRPSWLSGYGKTAIAALRLIHTSAGIGALFALVWHLLYGRKPVSLQVMQPAPWLRECSRLCYGVYVYHMFFMEPCYFHVGLGGIGMPAVFCQTTFGAWLLPWVVLLLTMLLSLTATWLTLKTKAGRYAIG
ncbi:MAG: acyltransferase family protein [Bacteroidales bacterium]|nr:acyltransferase family protein [Candidatus Colicola faecequi]